MAALPTPIGRFDRPRPLQMTLARGGTTSLTPLRFPVYTSGGWRNGSGEQSTVVAVTSEDCGESKRTPLRPTSFQGLPPPDLFRSWRAGDLRLLPDTYCRTGGAMGWHENLLVSVGVEGGERCSNDYPVARKPYSSIGERLFERGIHNYV